MRKGKADLISDGERGMVVYALSQCFTMDNIVVYTIRLAKYGNAAKNLEHLEMEIVSVLVTLASFFSYQVIRFFSCLKLPFTLVLSSSSLQI